MGLFGKKKGGKNKALNARFNALEMDMENNYKDAAHLDFKNAKALFAELKASGGLSAKDQAYYEERIAYYEVKLAHYSHAEGPGTGRFNADLL